MQSRLKALLAAAALAGVLAIGPALSRQAAASDTVVVRNGDTLSAIAARNGVTVEQLVTLNRMANPNRIYPGQMLRLKPAPRASRASQPKLATATPRTHRVRSGEHLTGIARRYRTTISAIVAANRLTDPGRIFAGQRLLIPGGSRPAATKTAARPATEAAVRSHRVRSGETLTSIARRYDTTIGAIVRANGIRNPSFVRTGTALRIPSPSGPTITAPTRTKTSARPIPPSMAALVAKRAGVRRIITEEAKRFGVPQAFALAAAWQESGWQQGVTSYAGAVGVMQLMPATGEWVGPAMLGHRVNLRDTRQNVRVGVRLLKHYLDRYHGDRARVLAAYYQGQTAVDRHGIYPVSRLYIASILYLEKLFD